MRAAVIVALLLALAVPAAAEGPGPGRLPFAVTDEAPPSLLPPAVPAPEAVDSAPAVPAAADGPRPRARPEAAADSVAAEAPATVRPRPRPAATGTVPLMPDAQAAAFVPRPAPAPARGAPEATLGDQAAALDAAASVRPPDRAVPAAGTAPVRPRQRPDAAVPAARAVRPEVAAAAIVPPSAVAALARSLRPAMRPAALAQRRAAPAAPRSAQPAAAAAAIIRPAPGGDPVLPRRGAVCGNPAIRGETIAPIAGRIRGCGIANPVRVTAVADVRLSTPAVMDCPTAQALHTWLERGAKPALARTGGGLVRLEVAAHYVCRTRNNRRGAPISEHGRGRAIDISGFTLANGQTIPVQGGWRGPHRDALRAAYRAACGPFGTTLGPGSDGYHEDHYHFDTARHRSGGYCR